MPNEQLTGLLKKSFGKNWDMPAFSDYEGATLSYGDVAGRIAQIHGIFSVNNIKKGDKISIAGKNSTNWAVAYLSVVTYGAVVVPILPDFKHEEIRHIVNHSDSVLLFCSEDIFDGLDPNVLPEVRTVVSLDDLEIIYHREKSRLMAIIEKVREFYEKKHGQPETKFRDTFSIKSMGNDELAAIVYTSGTTGFSKGVMLTHRSLTVNVLFAGENIPLKSGDSILSFLPLAHAFGCAFELLYPFTLGCHITFLGRTPSPRIILKAFSEIRPRLILSVPLVIEKIYREQIKKKFHTSIAGFLRKVPFVRYGVYAAVRKKLEDSFGGNFREMVIGGAALSGEVEEFLKAIKFPFTIGYGMTECGPLISFAPHKTHKKGTVGKIIHYLDVKIDSPDPYRTVGEILVKGKNVMLGYYKNESDTRAAIDADGWLHTGDLGIMDKKKNIMIRGRCKTMILGPSGQNIYPEEIESRLNNLKHVSESLVLERDGKVVALVFPDRGDAGEEELARIMESDRKKLNKSMPAYMAVSAIELFPKEFEKTPSKKIKRFLYK
jgi:long-chain acyl-CoA synthetase